MDAQVKDTELEDRSWYIWTMLIRIGHPSLPDEISQRCTLLNISPTDVEDLCCIPQSPICMTKGHMVTISEISISLFYDVSRKLLDPLDLIVPDTPVSTSSPSRTSSKDVRLCPLLQSYSLKNNSHAIKDNHPLSSPLFCRDVKGELKSIVHRKSSCHATAVCTSELDGNTIGATSTCGTTNIAQLVSSVSEGQLLRGIDHAKAVGLSLNCSRKRLRDGSPSAHISSKNPPKLTKVARSMFPESLENMEPLSPFEQYSFNPPVEPEVADDVIQARMNRDDGHECHYQMTLDHTSGFQTTALCPKRAITFDVLDGSKDECLHGNSHVRVIGNDVLYSETRLSAIVEDIDINENDIGGTLASLLKSKLLNRDDCKAHNESDHNVLESPLYIHDKFPLDSENKFKQEYDGCHTDETFKLEVKNSASHGSHSDGIKLDLILKSISKSAGQNDSCLPNEIVTTPEGWKVKKDVLEGYDRGNNRDYEERMKSIKGDIESNHQVSEFDVVPGQDPNHLHMEGHEPIVRSAHVIGVETDFDCLRGCSRLADSNLVNEKESRKESLEDQKHSEDQNSQRCNKEEIATCNKTNVSMDNEVLISRKTIASKMLETCHVKNMARTQGLKKNSSSKQKSERSPKMTVIDKVATAGDIISSQKQVQSRCIPIFEFFTIDEEEGSGGYGTVYKARRKHDDKVFAIKCPLEKTPKTHVTNEFLMLQRFGGSNFIIKLEDVLENNGQDCLILEYVLHDKPEVLRREITISELQWYCFCMFKALAALHRQGVIHRDIKPGNFLFSRKIKRGYLIDFNLALDQYDSISNRSNASVSSRKKNRSYMAEHGISCQRSVINDRSVVSRKQSMYGLKNGVGSNVSSKVSAYSTKEEREFSIKPLMTWCENKENMAVHLKPPMQVAPSGSSDIRSQKQFGQDILNTDLRRKLGGSSQTKNSTDRWTQVGAEAVREPLPTQGRKELLNLVQEARQKASFPVHTRKRIDVLQGKLESDTENKFHISTMLKNSNFQACSHGLSDLPKNAGIQKYKRDGPCVGTKGYRAPEVLIRSLHQGPKLDIWSAGVTLLNFIVGKSPFPASSTDQAVKDIAKMRGVDEILELSKLHDRQHTLPQDLHSLQFKAITIKEWCKKNTKRPEYLECIPLSLYDLIDKCLCVNPRLRIDADEALKHEFLAPCFEEYKERSSKE